MILLIFISLCVVIPTGLTQCNLIDPTTEITNIATQLNQWSYGGGSSLTGGVVSIRSGNPGQVTTVISPYCFQNSKVINQIKLDYRFVHAYTRTHGVSTTFQIAIFQPGTTTALWSSDMIYPYYGPNGPSLTQEAVYWYHGGGCSNCLINYSPTQTVSFQGLPSTLSNTPLQFGFVFHNNGRNMHMLQQDLFVTMYWDSVPQNPSECLAAGHSMTAWYDGSEIDLTTNSWTDKTGNGHNGVITGSGINVYNDFSTSPIDELLLNNQPIVIGTPTTKIDFDPTLSVKQKFTIFNLCKYRDEANVAGSRKKRILDADGSNSLFGFWMGNRAVYHPQRWITTNTQTSNLNDWLLSSCTFNEYRADGADVPITAGVPYTGSNVDIGVISINAGNHHVSESSDFACAEVIIFNDQELSDAEIECVEEYFQCKYRLPFNGGCRSYLPQCGDGGIAVVEGDPHYITWIQSRHHFQGQPAPGDKELFYYMYPCNGYDKNDMPIYMMGRHVRWRNYAVSGLDYITLRLFDGTTEYLLYLSATIRAWIQRPGSVINDYLYDVNKGAATNIVADGTAKTIGSGTGQRFAVTITPGKDVRIEITWDNSCSLEMYFTAQNNYNAALSRHQMNKLQIYPSKCLKCFTCGLLGSFPSNRRRLASTPSMETCDGSEYEYPTGFRGESGIYDENGWSWEAGFVENGCMVENGQPGSTPTAYEPVVDTSIDTNQCDASIEAQVKQECAVARGSLTCCDDSADLSKKCDDIQSNCEIDACISSAGDETQIDDNVNIFFNEAAQSVCDIPEVVIDDTNECDTNPCGQHALCRNTIGSYECICTEGWTGNGQSCTDIDECIGDNPCDDNKGQCVNVQGSYECKCNDGYRFDDVTCQDINECDNDADNNCDVNNASCENDEGSFICKCNDGFTGNGVTCTDINECEPINPCGDGKGSCQNVPGSYNCQCNVGYRFEGGTCQDINECDEDSDDCDPNATCKNTEGSFECKCNPGFNGDGKTCTDIDECIGDNPCGVGKGSCTNAVGSYNCQCNVGYTFNAGTCQCVGETVCCPNGIGTFDWDTLTEKGEDVPNIDVIEFYVDDDDLSLNLLVELDYLGAAKADDERTANFGVTYVLDFEDYDAHKRLINKPGTCENRKSSSFDTCTTNNFDTCWGYSVEPQNGNVGRSDNTFLSYPEAPSDKWQIYMKDDGCDTVIYKGHFTWQQLRDCKGFNDGDDISYTSVISDDKWLNLTGTFYVNVVSPYWYGSKDYKYYRVYQILSQPFIIAVSSSVYVLGSAGINLMTMSVVAVYKEDDETDFKLVLMTETADYMKLERDTTLRSLDFFNKAGSNNDINAEQINFVSSIDPDNTNCLENKDYLCTQLWRIEAINIECKPGNIGTDFSGKYGLSFKPKCKSGDYLQYCTDWLNDHTDIRDKPISLSTDLIWEDTICKPEVFTVALIANMLFYTNGNYEDGKHIDTESYLYQVGKDEVFVEIITDFPADTLTIFNTKLINVWLCTFAPNSNVPQTTDGTESEITSMGCFNSQRDTEYDTSFRKIYTTSKVETIAKPHSFDLISEAISNIVRFSFIVPYEVARDTLYVHAQIEVELQELAATTPPRRRRRMLLNVNSATNKMAHFGDQIGINHGPKQEPPKQPKQPQQPQQEPQEPFNYNPPKSNPSTFMISSESPWIVAIGCLLGLVLTFNIIFMCYMNCYKNGERGRGRIISFGSTKKGYDKVRADDSEFDQSERNEINVISQ